MITLNTPRIEKELRELKSACRSAEILIRESIIEADGDGRNVSIRFDGDFGRVLNELRSALREPRWVPDWTEEDDPLDHGTMTAGERNESLNTRQP